MSLEDLSLAEIQAELARREADAGVAAATAARAGLASGAVGDVGAPDIHPHAAATQAIADAINKQHRSQQEAMAVGVGVIMSAAAKGDTRVNYTGRTAPGA